MRAPLLALTIASLTSVFSFAQAPASKTLDIYIVDVEGGNATLFVSPSGESMLIDTGNAGAMPAARDAGRILEAANAAGLQHIEPVITTHSHADHFGRL